MSDFEIEGGGRHKGSKPGVNMAKNAFFALDCSGVCNFQILSKGLKSGFGGAKSSFFKHFVFDAIRGGR